MAKITRVVNPNEICIVVDQEVAAFAKNLAVGHSLKIMPVRAASKMTKKELDEINIFDPIEFKICGSVNDMSAFASNVQSKWRTLNQLTEAFKKAEIKLETKLHRTINKR